MRAVLRARAARGATGGCRAAPAFAVFSSPRCPVASTPYWRRLRVDALRRSRRAVGDRRGRRPPAWRRPSARPLRRPSPASHRPPASRRGLADVPETPGDGTARQGVGGRRSRFGRDPDAQRGGQAVAVVRRPPRSARRPLQGAASASRTEDRRALAEAAGPGSYSEGCSEVHAVRLHAVDRVVEASTGVLLKSASLDGTMTPCSGGVERAVERALGLSASSTGVSRRRLAVVRELRDRASS